MDDQSSSAPAEPAQENQINPVPDVPPEQEHQTQNPAQEKQTRTGPPEEEEEAPEVTASTPIGDLIKDAFFLADNLGEPEVSLENPRQIHFYYPADESMVIIRLEARPGKWQGLSPIGHSDADKERANKHFDQQKKLQDDRRKTAQEAAQAESHDDATARRESKPENVEEQTTHV